jgi:spermidine/putrescine transport system substrate-binding protein
MADDRVRHQDPQASAGSALSRRRLLQAAGALGGAAVLAGLPHRPAYAKTTMTWMGWQGYETPILSGSFLKDNDIDFQPTFIASNEEIISKLQAGGIGKTDLVSMYFGYLGLMDEAGMIEPIDQSKVAPFGQLVPEFTGTEAIRRDGRLLGIPWNWGSLPLMYDPAVVPAAPESWMDIFKDEYKGKVAMVDDPLTYLLVWGTVVTGRPGGTLLSREELKKMIDLMITLKKQHARAFSPSYGDMADAFARNEVVVSCLGWDAVAVWAKAKGKDIRYTIPKEGTGLFMDCLVIPKDAPHPDLSYRMINHVLSPEPQRVFATEQSAGITNLDTMPLLPADLAQSYGYADLKSKLQKARLQPMPPTDYDGKTATYDDFLQEYQRLQKA